LCGEAGLQVRFRSGGELCQPAGRAHHRPLKKWLQDMHVPPWLRDRLPMLYSGSELLAVAGLFTCSEHTAASGEAGLRIEWLERPSLA
jgi:tRNA(Ile)-lysidine synthase